jgi:hypothetical protein
VHEVGDVMHVAGDMINILLVKRSGKNIYKAHYDPFAIARHYHLFGDDIGRHALHDGSEQFFDAVVTLDRLTEEETGPDHF